MLTDNERAALQALTSTRNDPGLINHLLIDDISTNRVRQVLYALAELHLQMPEDRFAEAANNLNSDFNEGIGWILLSCSQALGLLEELRLKDGQRRALQEVRS